MDEKQKRIYNALKGMESEAMLDTILDYHGTGILNSGFEEHLVDEGILEDDNIDEDEEDDEDV